jgi:hypothetical protein
MNMKTRIILLSVVTLLATLCVGVSLAQPSSITPLIGPTTNDTILLGGITIAYPPENSSIVSPIIMPYPYPYPGPSYSIQGIIQQLLDAKDGTYTGLSVNTINYVTTIKADEITVNSNSQSLHVTNLSCVIDKEANTISVTASLIDYKQGTTTFSGKDVSFTTPYYEVIPMMGTGTVSPQPSK